MKTYQVQVQSIYGGNQTLTVQAPTPMDAYKRVVEQGWARVSVVE
jgi:hypothetical protein